MPAGPFALFVLLAHELLIGLIIGTVARIIMASVHTTGTVIAFQVGLAAAQSFDPNQGGQSALVATFMTVIAVTLVFVTETHHLMIEGMYFSYTRFPVGGELQVLDFAMLVTKMVSTAFELGVQLASPFMVYGLVYNVSLGLVARLMPQMPVFFVGMPLNIILGFLLLSLVIGSIMTVYTEHFIDLLTGFMG